MTDAVVRMPSQAKPGEIVPVRALARHVQESGFRHDNVGKLIARNIVETFVCRYGGEEVFRAKLTSGITTNPYFLFYVKARESGDLEFIWTDDRGKVIRATARLEVVAS